jgi:thiamine-phosphate pyrophosphorylase
VKKLRMSRLPMPPRGLYFVTRESEDGDALLRTVAAALDGGARLVQYRDKSGDRARRELQARAVRTLCHACRVPLVVNDDVALAATGGADGVHLGEHDASPRVAREVLGADAIVGVSCYDALERAAAAALAGASYLAFGAFHPTATKPGARRADPAVLREAARFALPRVAIGGITADNARALIDAGADLVAVVGAINDAADPRAAARAIAAQFTSSRKDPA